MRRAFSNRAWVASTLPLAFSYPSPVFHRGGRLAPNSGIPMSLGWETPHPRVCSVSSSPQPPASSLSQQSP